MLIHFLAAFIIRVGFTFYGLYHDHVASISNDNIPKYTDIDYQVFTDAARFLYKGGSPYDRDTYRYTPLLAILMQPNIFLHEAFGKFLFIAFDLLCGYLILKINSREDNQKKLHSIIFWFYNPITIAISSRGNAESLMAFLVLIFVFFLKLNMMTLAGIFYGVAIHFKIYPLIYGLALFFYLIRLENFKNLNFFDAIKSIICNKNLWCFGISSIFTIFCLTYVFYLSYGWPFLEETYFYHLVRQDIRHNFSPYFYMLYLSDLTLANSFWIKLFCFLPQLLLIITISICFYRNLEMCLFLLTFVFVCFNKVCTSQYFIWYISILPILLPQLKITLKKVILCTVLWLSGQVLWLYSAYELEFLGKNTFLEIWISGLIMLILNCLVIKIGILDCFEIKSTKKKLN